MSEARKKFDQAAVAVKKLKHRPDNDDLLELYALYKQATEGDVSGKQPGVFDVVNRAKYDRWAKKKGTSADAAMKSYIKLVERLIAND
jgi:acyl-CoA-binding protein